jgi:hypothetical protein
MALPLSCLQWGCCAGRDWHGNLTLSPPWDRQCQAPHLLYPLYLKGHDAVGHRISHLLVLRNHKRAVVGSGGDSHTIRESHQTPP